MQEWSWTQTETECLTLQICIRHLDSIVQDLSYLGLPGLRDIAETLVRARVALQNIVDDNYECDC